MSYRQSSYDGLAAMQPGAPLRPFNRVQWAGVAFGAAGLVFFLAHLAGRIGGIEIKVGSTAALACMVIGTLLIHSRREPPRLWTSEDRARSRGKLVLALILAAALVGLGTSIAFQGA